MIISAAEGVTETTKQHFHLAFALKVPVIVLVTKLDLIDEEKLLKVREQVKLLLKSSQFSRISIVIKTNTDVDLATKSFEENIVPILFISNKSGQGLDLLIRLLNSLPPHNDWQSMIKDRAEVNIHCTFA